MGQLRLVREVGVRVALRRWWDGPCPLPFGFHDVAYKLADVVVDGWEAGGQVETWQDYLHEPEPPPADPRWPAVCRCGQPVPAEAHRMVYVLRLFDSPSGEPEPHDCYLTAVHHDHENRCLWWDDCAAPHLMVVLPTGDHWDVDSRASNCTLPQDRRHRCWVRHGTPPQVTVDKGGVTCAAGAGSIQVPGWHGFLQGGQLIQR